MNIGFKHHKVGELEYLTIPSFDDTGLVKHCFTTRLGGVSSGECTSLNLGFNRKDTEENVKKNYKIITNQIDVEYEKLVFSNQVHEDKIAIVSDNDMRQGLGHLKGVDGLITNQPGVPLITFYADCVPLFFLDPVKKVIGLVHSGWRGTVKKIGEKTIEKMNKTFGCNSQNILVAIGPSIGQCHFEVDKPVVDEFIKAYGQQASNFIEGKENGKYSIDLWQLNILQFIEKGIIEENITLAKECSSCNKDMYFSHREDKGKTGSLASIMQLNV